jgi:hypothetical protein
MMPGGRPGGRFWVLKEDAEAEFPEEVDSDEETLGAPPAAPTLGDAIDRARDLRGARRKGSRKAELEEARKRIARGSGTAPALPPFRYAQTSPSRPHRTSLEIETCPALETAEVVEDSGDWFQIRNGKLVRIGENNPRRSPSRYRTRTIWRATPAPNRGLLRLRFRHGHRGIRVMTSLSLQVFSFPLEPWALGRKHRLPEREVTVLGWGRLGFRLVLATQMALGREWNI